MQFLWDETKRLSNIRKHRIDFADVLPLFDGDIVTVEDSRIEYGKQRYFTIGLLKGRTITVVHTEQDNKIRLISARKATKYEEIRYVEQTRN